jgi:CheY-like chemotaxis protein
MTDFCDHNDHRMRILLVGSENALCESLDTLLENDGHEVLAARDGRHALTIFHRSMRPINLLVTDYNTPDITGLELARACEYHNPDVAVLYISASAPNEELQTDLATHRRAFLAKPVRRSDLLRKTRELLAPGFAPLAIPEPPEFQPAVQMRFTEESARDAS